MQHWDLILNEQQALFSSLVFLFLFFFFFFFFPGVVGSGSYPKVFEGGEQLSSSKPE